MEIQYLTALLTLLIGLFYTRGTFKKSSQKTDYVDWNEFNRMLERQRILGKV